MRIASSSSSAARYIEAVTADRKRKVWVLPNLCTYRARPSGGPLAIRMAAERQDVNVRLTVVDDDADMELEHVTELFHPASYAVGGESVAPPGPGLANYVSATQFAVTFATGRVTAVQPSSANVPVRWGAAH